MSPSRLQAPTSTRGPPVLAGDDAVRDDPPAPLRRAHGLRTLMLVKSGDFRPETARPGSTRALPRDPQAMGKSARTAIRKSGLWTSSRSRPRVSAGGPDRAPAVAVRPWAPRTACRRSPAARRTALRRRWVRWPQTRAPRRRAHPAKAGRAVRLRFRADAGLRRAAASPPAKDPDRSQASCSTWPTPSRWRRARGCRPPRDAPTVSSPPTAVAGRRRPSYRESENHDWAAPALAPWHRRRSVRLSGRSTLLLLLGFSSRRWCAAAGAAGATGSAPPAAPPRGRPPSAVAPPPAPPAPAPPPCPASPRLRGRPATPRPRPPNRHDQAKPCRPIRPARACPRDGHASGAVAVAPDAAAAAARSTRKKPIAIAERSAKAPPDPGPSEGARRARRGPAGPIGAQKPQLPRSCRDARGDPDVSRSQAATARLERRRYHQAAARQVHDLTFTKPGYAAGYRRCRHHEGSAGTTGPEEASLRDQEGAARPSPTAQE